MKQAISIPHRLICIITLICGLLFCNLTAYAAEIQQATNDFTVYTEDMLFPSDVQNIEDDSGRQIIKTYILADSDSPEHIPRDSFVAVGWQYELADVAQSRAGSTDTKPHIETIEIESESNDLNEVLSVLSTTLNYESGDGYSGQLLLDLASVECEAAGYSNHSYTVSATREYTNLPANDLYYIPKTVTESGRTLEFDSVEWAAQSFSKAGYTDIPASYRAIAKYTGKAVQSVATGYIITANYHGAVTRTDAGDTIYTLQFIGTEIAAAPQETEPPLATKDSGSTASIAIVVTATAVIALLGGAAAFFFLRHNIKVYALEEDGSQTLVAKVRINAKNPVIDLTPLGERVESRCFILEIDKFAAKPLNGSTVDAIYTSAKLCHKVAYEGNPYKIKADFYDMSIKAIY